jgi:hypothetical protein
VKAAKGVSPVDELRTIEKVVEGALLLLDGAEPLTFDGDPNDAAKAILALAVSRLRQLWQVVRRTLDPEAIRSGHNVAEPSAPDWEDPDIRLASPAKPHSR